MNLASQLFGPRAKVRVQSVDHRHKGRDAPVHRLPSFTRLHLCEEINSRVVRRDPGCPLVVQPFEGESKPNLALPIGALNFDLVEQGLVAVTIAAVQLTPKNCTPRSVRSLSQSKVRRKSSRKCRETQITVAASRPAAYTSRCSLLAME